MGHGARACEDLAGDIRLYLQSLGKEITAEKLMEYLQSPEVREKHGIDKTISLSTASTYLHELGYRFGIGKKGQYTDGHKRTDVVDYRQKVYLPRFFDLQKCIYIYNTDDSEDPEKIIPTVFQVEGRRVIIWYHDESIFYAHDRRRRYWYHKDDDCPPYRKGEGASFMVVL
jgi:hypothetical protein